ncbi:MAG: sugar porter family MFS transporter [Flavobacteriaceae bacterium]|nr:sugar porter family MFS transporter [Flavobacteriaceae bacterium]
MSNSKLYYWSITVALAGFLFGFDTVVISGADKALQALWSGHSLFGDSDAFHGIIVMSSALWGTVLGAIFGAYPTNKWGRKNTLLLIGILYTVSAFGSAMVSDPYLFAFFRFIGGIGVGASTIAAPAYVSEIAPAKKRGQLVALYQLNIVFGILVAFASNYLINANIQYDSWRWMIGIEGLPAIIYTFMVIGITKSPRWLILKGKTAEASKTLTTLNPNSDVSKEIAEIQSAQQDNSRGESVFTKKYRIPLLLVFALAAFNQFSGINAFLYYSPRIFELAGLEESAALMSSIGVGVVNLLFTLLGMFLIDKLGRKQLMYMGSMGYIISLGLVTYAFSTGWLGMHVPAFFFLFIAAHAIGQGAVIWVFISELFPNHLRAQGQSVGSSTHWVLAAIIPALLPLLFSKIGPATVFGIFAFMMILQLLWVHFIMPETKGIPLEELSSQLSGEKDSKQDLDSIIKTNK